MCDDVSKIIRLVKTVKEVEKRLKRELTYTDMQIILQAEKKGIAFQIGGQVFEVNR